MNVENININGVSYYLGGRLHIAIKGKNNVVFPGADAKFVKGNLFVDGEELDCLHLEEKDAENFLKNQHKIPNRYQEFDIVFMGYFGYEGTCYLVYQNGTWKIDWRIEYQEKGGKKIIVPRRYK